MTNGPNKATESSGDTAGSPATNDIDDDVAEAVERSYASRITASTDLASEELKRVRDRQATAAAGPEEAGDKQ